MVLELRVLLSKRSSHLNCYHPLRYQPWILSKGNLPRANTMARVDQGYLSSLSKRYSRLNHYETFCSLKGDFAVVHYEPYCSHSWNLAKGRFYYGSLWTLLLPLLESYQWEIFMWFAMNLTAPTLRILPRRDFSVVRYEPYCSHSWNLTKGIFFCGSLWTLLLPLLESYQGKMFLWFAMKLTTPTLGILPREDFSMVRYEPYCFSTLAYSPKREAH